MKRITVLFLKLSLLLITGAFLVSSCSKQEKTDYKRFISKEFKISYTKTEIVNLLDLVGTTYPEADALKQSVLNDVDVYKVTYRTTVSNEEITASGLVCVPGTSGEYPVLCFQNGTNTVKANAPSEYVGNPLYQMIELVASLGYIVIIPDYPGFGESGNIVHPYLIAEPTVKSIIDMLYAVKESVSGEFPGIVEANEYYLLGYSQGGWATLALHKSMEQDYSSDFNLAGSACGAGPYDMKMLFGNIINSPTYTNPVFLCYIAYSYKHYNQITNPLTEILNDPYAARVPSLFNGEMTSAQINGQLTVSMPELLRADLIPGFESSDKFASVRDGLIRNSVTAWKTNVPLFFLHGGDDISVDPQVTLEMHQKMLDAGTSPDICRKEIVAGVDHGKGIIPCMIKGLMFIRDIRTER